MTKVSKIEALDTFSHGRLNMRAGDVDKIESSEAHDLQKIGLVKIIGEHEPDDDLLGAESKMEPILSNKMEKAPANKAAPKHK